MLKQTKEVNIQTIHTKKTRKALLVEKSLRIGIYHSATTTQRMQFYYFLTLIYNLQGNKHKNSNLKGKKCTTYKTYHLHSPQLFTRSIHFALFVFLTQTENDISSYVIQHIKKVRAHFTHRLILQCILAHGQPQVYPFPLKKLISQNILSLFLVPVLTRTYLSINICMKGELTSIIIFKCNL